MRLRFFCSRQFRLPRGYTDTTLPARYNERRSVESLFAGEGKDIACVIVEPCAANMGVVHPSKEFLQFLRSITKRYGSVLIFDEVITGFKLGIGGAQAYYGVTPDMTTLEKIVSGGMPLAVYEGRREIMECVASLGSVYQAGTLSVNPVAVSAGIAAIEELEKSPEIYDELERKSAMIEAAMKEVGLRVNRCGSLLTAFFTNEDVTDYDSAKSADTATYAECFRYLPEHGIYTAPSQFETMFVSAAHSDSDIKITCKIISGFQGKGR